MAGFLLSQRAVETLVDDHRQLSQLYSNLLRQLQSAPQTFLQASRPKVLFLNNSGEEAPAYAVMEPTAGARGPYVESRITITKPSTTFRRLYLVNGSTPVANGKTGEGTWLMDDYGGPVLYDSGDGTPAYGESWGAKNGQWKLAKNRPGFLVSGANNTSASNPYTAAIQYIVNELLGKTDATHNKSASGTISVWMGAAGSEADTTMNITAYNRFANLASGKWVWCSWSNGGWYLTAGEC